MTILIVSTYYPPLSSAASLRPYSWAKYWTREGHDVTVLTTAKREDPSTALGLPDPGCTVREVPWPVTVGRLKRMQAWMTGERRQVDSRHGAGPSALARRAARALDRQRARFGVLGAGPRLPDVADLWAFGALKTAKAPGPWDVVVSTAAPYVAHLVAARLKRRGLSRQWIADYRDLWTDHRTAPGLPGVRVWERRFEVRLLRSADVITTVSEPLADTLRLRHGASRIHVVENGVDAEDFERLDPAPVFLRDGKRRIVYTGTIYDPQDPSPLLQALAEMAHAPGGASLLSGVEVVLATRSTARLADLVRRFGVDRWVRVEGLVPRPHALRMQRDADLLLLLPWNDPNVDGILTTKVYEYLFSDAPILLVGCRTVEALQRLVLDAGRGIRLPDASAVRTFLTDYLRNPAPARAPRSSAILDRYDRRRLAIRLLSLAGPELRGGRPTA
jgi:glycosyltransferase involved in cell wall biosynthesis